MVKTLFFVILSSLCFINIAHGLKCYKCDSSKDINCIDDLTKLSPEECKNGETSCVTLLNSKGGLSRECLGDGETCYENFCKECNEDGCNKNIACFECDSAKNLNCITNNKTSPVVCPGEKDKCITEVKTDKTVERKCVSETKICDETKAKTCEVCDKALCNKESFPKNRRLCYQCTKENADCGELKNIKTMPCPFYDENDKCYTIGTSPTDMNRGCMSDLSDSGTKCSGETCVTCDSQSCNNQPYSRPPTRKCFQCAVNETKCVKDAYVCKKPVAYWKQKEECFTQTSGGKTSQGCVNDRETTDVPCTTENSCKICDKDGCNSGVSLTSTIISIACTFLTFSSMI